MFSQVSAHAKLINEDSCINQLHTENIPLISFPLRGINPVTTNSISSLTANVRLLQLHESLGGLDV